MFLAIVSLMFFLAVVQGFVRVVMYFWDWLSQGEKLDRHEVSRAEQALEGSEDVLERELARAKDVRGFGRVFARWRASKEAVEEYLNRIQLGWYQVIIIFFVGCMAGLLLEEIWMLLTAGLTENRVGLVWGPFSIVWGLAIALATWFLYNYRDRSDGFLFAFGTFLGGAYEYICSVFTEIVFGKVFWDYSDIPFNLGGRINLLYCFFWGIAAVVWLKKFYPVISRWIEKIPMKFGKIITWILIVFMVANMLVSTLALARYDERAHQKPAANAIEQTIDAHFPDARMEKIYPNAKAIN